VDGSLLSVEVEHTLRDFELAVALHAPRGCLALAGPSGAGKTTLLRIVAGLVRPDRGRVSCDGEAWTDTDAGRFVPPERRSCGYLFQDYALFPHMRAWQNVAYPLQGLPRGARRERAESLLARFGVDHLSDARADELSGGERQRVALARTLARPPRVLLLDEPLAALDPGTRATAARELERVLREEAVPALLVTHDYAQAAQLGDAVAVMDRGRIVQVGPPAELAAQPASSFVADFLGASVLHGVARPGPGGLTVLDLDGGGEIASTDSGSGPVAASVFPWEVTLEPPGTEDHGSAQNRLAGRVLSIVAVGNRVRVSLATPQPLGAEITEAALERLRLEVGDPVEARWKATATRLAPL
jgi:molybdate transport system ATP-binding protein